ncbi:unnamed protein product [Arctogadus glacialis]
MHDPEATSDALLYRDSVCCSGPDQTFHSRTLKGFEQRLNQRDKLCPDRNMIMSLKALKAITDTFQMSGAVRTRKKVYNLRRTVEIETENHPALLQVQKYPPRNLGEQKPETLGREKGFGGFCPKPGKPSIPPQAPAAPVGGNGEQSSSTPPVCRTSEGRGKGDG